MEPWANLSSDEVKDPLNVPQLRTHHKGDMVSGTIEGIFPFGIFVRLTDGTKAYIRKRELSFSGDREPDSLVHVGDPIGAMVIAPEAPGRQLELSLKATMPDPWLDFARRYRLGSEVEGVVKSVVNNGAYVEVIPGVSGFVPRDQIAPQEVTSPNRILWPDDRVKAIIMRLDFAQHGMLLSMRQYISTMERAALVQSVTRRLQAQDVDAATHQEISGPVEFGPLAEESDQINLYAPILVVEDRIDLRQPLVRWLRDHGCEAQGANSPQEALDMCQRNRYALMLADLDMPEMDGVSLIAKLREASIDIPIAVMSNPDLIAEKLPKLRTLDVAITFPKPLEYRDILEFLSRLALGQRPTLVMQDDDEESTSQLLAPPELPASTRSREPLVKRINKSLEQLVADTSATAGVIFHLELASRQVSMSAHQSSVALRTEALPSLAESPVMDVMVRDSPLIESHVTRDRFGQFRELLDLLAFESCIGIPLLVAGHLEHALFLFHKDAARFSAADFHNARATAALVSALLEGQALDERLRAMGGLLLSGQLAAGFSHEVHNRLAGLDLQIQNLNEDVARVAREHTRISGSASFQAVRHALGQAVQASADFTHTVQDFRGLMENRGDSTIDLNQVIRQAEGLMQMIARRANTEIRLNLEEGLPTAVGAGLGLQQVFLNLMLNGIQHMKLKGYGRRVLTISTALHEGDGVVWEQARVTDTGPGIHRQQWDKVFDLGFTTRPEGSGLGLFIARSLVTSLGGRISIESSAIPIGTTFLVELPVPHGKRHGGKEDA